MNRPAALLLATLGVLAADIGRAQSVGVEIDADSVSIGERTTLTVWVVHDGSRRALFPDDFPGEYPPEAIGIVGDFELLRRRSEGSRLLADGGRLDSVTYESATFSLDSARVATRAGAASERDTVALASMAFAVPVRSIVPPETEDVRDIKPLAEFPRAWWPWLLALALAGVAFWLWRRFGRRQEEELDELEEPEPELAEPPLSEALRRLASLSDVDLGTEEAYKPYFVELSDILRTYVARRIGTPALELTTAELVDRLRDDLRAGRVSDRRIAEVEQLLTAADLVKFADIHPAEDRARLALGATRTTIERTEADLAPRPAPVPHVATEPGREAVQTSDPS